MEYGINKGKKRCFMDEFEIPIVLFSFKRVDKLLKIINQIAKIKPKKLYLLSDGGRTKEEHSLVEHCRNKMEEAISWNCKIIKKYAQENIGVYENIGLGARWVFEREKIAIFLEDDNLPELTFFQFCKEMLYRYNNDTRVLWICGTNYLQEYTPKDGSSYMFTKHMLPCGWASWAEKFSRYYDGDLDLWKDHNIKVRVRKEPIYKPLLTQDIQNWDAELRRINRYGKPASWDYQMGFTMRVHNLYAIVPKYNQIKNIGVDVHSIHGGISLDNVMTKRFCYIPTTPLEFPLVHPKAFFTDEEFELKTARIIVYPLKMRIKISIANILKDFLGIDRDSSISKKVKSKNRK